MSCGNCEDTKPVATYEEATRKKVDSLSRNVADHEKTIGELTARVNNLNYLMASFIRDGKLIKLNDQQCWTDHCIVDLWMTHQIEEQQKARDERNAIAKVEQLGYLVLKKEKPDTLEQAAIDVVTGDAV